MKALHLNENCSDRIKRDMVEFVNAQFPEDDDPVMTVRQILDKSDVVFGLWQDAEEPNGVVMYVIKGKNLMPEIVARKKGAKVGVAAVPCENAEHAIAAEQYFGGLGKLSGLV